MSAGLLKALRVVSAARVQPRVRLLDMVYDQLFSADGDTAAERHRPPGLVPRDGGCRYPVGRTPQNDAAASLQRQVLGTGCERRDHWNNTALTIKIFSIKYWVLTYIYIMTKKT